MKKIIYIIGIFFSLLIYLIFNILDLPINFWTREIVVGLIVVYLVFKSISGPTKKRLLTSVGISLLGLLVTFVFSSWVHDYAMWKICQPAIEKKLGKPIRAYVDENDNSYLKTWYQHLECEDNLLPFPWGKEAKFSDNPPGFVPKEASDSGKAN